MRRVSSSATHFYQFVFAPIWIIGFGSGAILVLYNPNVDPAYLKVAFPIVWVIGSVFCLTVFRYAIVDISESHHRITRLWKTQDIPWTSVSGIGGSKLIEPATVSIHFKLPTQFGRSISFLPNEPLFPIRTSCRIREELQRMLDKAR